MKSGMKRVLSFGAIVGIALLAGLTPAPRSTAAEAPAARPNIVVVMSDDQAVESMRVMANVNTMLGAEGTTFADNYVSFPLCCPSRTTFLTGQYGHNHTVMGNAMPQGGYEKLAPTHANTLPAWLKLAGYHTVHIGKYLNGYGRQRPTEVPPGWDEWFGSVDPSTYRYYDYTLNENGKLVHYGTAAADYQADVYTAKAVDAVKRLATRTEPFFLSVAYLAPHNGGPRESDDPANLGTPAPAPRHRNRFSAEPMPRTAAFNEADVSDKPLAVRRRPLFGPARINGITEMYRQRLESILAVDEGVAAIVRALQDSGELSRTLFVYTSDNGFFHGEHRIPNGKVQHYEPSARVPLVMRGPGVPRGVRITQPSINVDLAPTLVDAANAKVGRATDGVSLLALLADRTRFVGRDVLLETPTYAAIHTPRYVYVEHNTGERELYDLRTDPDELASLHENTAYAQVRSDLARRLLALRACKAAVCRKGPALSVSSRCAGKKHRVALAGSDGRLVTRVDWIYRGRAAGADAKSPFQVVLAGAAGVLRANATLDDGRRASVDRRLAVCR
ncbi:MAG: N-acetylglucosamine-6-sulfatase [Gaiellaceae bacterium]|jgi:arylsulfatase A-like enzyme|nr:N-acetylglucosamine-6-sulfatase [Gaiellaceae bacterium]